MDNPRKWSSLASKALLTGAVVMLALSAWRIVNRPSILWHLRPLPSVSSASGSDGALLVIYQAKDCASHAAFIERWNRLHRPGAFEVVGVPLDADNPAPWAQRALEDLAPTFPIRAELGEAARSIIAGMQAGPTPLAVLVDASGRPKMVVRSVKDPRDLANAHDLVLAYIALQENSQ